MEVAITGIRLKNILLLISNKSNICRIKPEGIHGNHPKQWIYIDNGRAEKYKCNIAPYGGTRLHGKSFFRNGEWENRSVWNIVH